MLASNKNRNERRTRLYRLFLIVAPVLVLVPGIAWSHANSGVSADPWTNWPLSLDILLPVIIAGAL